ncbi:MAG: hypothetical protein ACOYNC_09175 [Bacteroidales bacterium]
MYILKTEGVGKVPDYIQIRDDSFALIAYFKVTSPRTALERCGLILKMEEILAILNDLDYGKLTRAEL